MARHLTINGSKIDVEKLTIPSSISTINDYAFYNNLDIKSLTIPNSITSIGISAFAGCHNLQSAVIGNSVQSIGDNAFIDCESLNSLTIGTSVSEIGDNAFAGCESLTEVNLPNTLISIGDQALDDCTNLSAVYSYAKTPPTISNYIIDSPSTILYVPYGCKETYQTARGWKDFQTVNEMPVAIHTITYMVDGETYKTVKLEEGATITPEPSPTKDGYVFSGWSTIPETMGTEDLTVTGTFSPMCATPQVSYSNGKLTFKCTTEGAKYHYTIVPSTLSSEAETENGEIPFVPNYTISVYATADGYVQSETSTITYGVDAASASGDINNDGSLDITDITYLVNKVLGRKISLVGDAGFDALMCQQLGVDELTKEILATVTTLPTISHQGDDGFSTIDLTYFSNLKNIGGSCINYNDKLSKIILPPNLQYIGEYGIINNGNVHTLEFPASLNYIGYKALWNSWDNYATAKSLNELQGWHSLVFDGETPPTLQLGTNADYNPIGPACDEDKLNGVYNLGFRIYVPDDAVESYKTAEGWTYWAKFIVGKSSMK